MPPSTPCGSSSSRADGRHRRDRRGREGRGADALQRRAHRRRHAARSRHRRRPHRRHHPHRPRARQRPLGHRRERAGHDVRPRPVRLHGEDRGRARVRRRDRHPALAVTENIEAVAKAKGESVRDVTAVILDRDRHADLIAEIRATGARIRLIPDGDVAGAISTAWPDSGADILLGIGGTPEGVISAAALKCMGGELQGRLWPRNDGERAGRHRRRLRPRPGAHHRRSRAGRQLLLRRHRHHRRRAAAGRALRPAAAPPPSPWSCGRSRAPSAWSTPTTASTSCGTSPPSPSTDHSFWG